MKKACAENGYRHIDNGNITADDLYDGLHLNGNGALKLAKNISSAVKRRTTTTTENDNANENSTFRKIKVQTIGENAAIRKLPDNRKRPQWATARNAAQRVERTEPWPTLPNRPNWATNGQHQHPQQPRNNNNNNNRLAQHQAEFMNTLINTLLNSNAYQ